MDDSEALTEAVVAFIELLQIVAFTVRPSMTAGLRIGIS